MKKIIYLGFIATLAIPSMGIAKDDSWLSTISEDTRGLLQQEMHSLESGLQESVVALAKGNFKKLCDIALKMRNSYVLMQDMSHKQHEELHEKAPASFLKADQNFHYYAGMLAHVAEKENAELSVFYLSKVTESCVSCHQEHAQHRFSGFNAEAFEHKHAH